MSENSRQDKVTLKVEDVMTREVITVDENVTFKEAADIMDKKRDKPLNCAWERKGYRHNHRKGPLKSIIVEARNPEKTKVRKVMSSPVQVITHGTDLEIALWVMFRKRIKKLAVVDKESLLGLVSLTNFARCQPALITLLKSFVAARDIPKSMKQILKHYIV